MDFSGEIQILFFTNNMKFMSDYVNSIWIERPPYWIGGCLGKWKDMMSIKDELHRLKNQSSFSKLVNHKKKWHKCEFVHLS